MEKEFINLLNQHQGIVYKICRMYCYDSDDRQDLFQEIVLQLWKAYPSFKKESNISTWIYRIGMNTAISNYRKEKRKQSPTTFSNMLSEIPDLAENYEIPPETAPLHKAIDRLSSIEKAIVLLYLEDKTYEEIAGITGISKTNVGVKINRIKGKLEKLINHLPVN